MSTIVPVDGLSSDTFSGIPFPEIISFYRNITENVKFIESLK